MHEGVLDGHYVFYMALSFHSVSIFVCCRVTCGEENVLFHLLQLEVGEGVLIEAHNSLPSTPSTCTPPSLHAQILHNFQATCGHIHHVLQAAARSKVSPCRMTAVPLLVISVEI